MIKAIFWDNDGVLVDTERLYFLATQRVLETIGITLTKAQYIELFMVQSTGAWELAADRGIPPDGIEELRQQRNDLYSELLRREPLAVDGVREVLAALHPTHLMGVVTSSRADHFALIHERTGFLPYFRFVLTAGDYARSKPHPEPYLRAVERSGFDKDECLVVEDSERGLAAAVEAGIRCIIVPSDLTRGRPFAGAHKVLNSLAEVLMEVRS
jgi:HAD superfamily hydrolase (TIGR01509 family)